MWPVCQIAHYIQVASGQPPALPVAAHNTPAHIKTLPNLPNTNLADGVLRPDWRLRIQTPVRQASIEVLNPITGLAR